MRCKLGRVDENRHDRLFVRLFRVMDEAEVSRVQGPHGGHEPDRLTVTSNLLPPLSTTCQVGEQWDGGFWEF